MSPEFDFSEIVVCAIRPAGNWSHLGSLVGFVIVAWFVSPSSRRSLRWRR